MTIQTLKHQYYILQRLDETEVFIHFLGREEKDARGKRLYDIFQIRDRELAVKLIMIFMEQMSNRAFEDFYECFSRDGELYLVFVHKEAVSLAAKLEGEACVLKERTAIGKNILERLLLLNMPDMLAWDVLRADTIQVTPALDIHFLYSLKEISNFEAVTIEKTENRMADIFSLLFQRELSLESSPDIPVFLEHLRKGEYQDYRQVYEAYLRLAEQLESPSAALHPNTFWFRVWDRVKKVYQKAKPVLLTLLFLILVVYLIYSILYPASGQNEQYNFQQIGTLEIIDGEEEAEE